MAKNAIIRQKAVITPHQGDSKHLRSAQTAAFPEPVRKVRLGEVLEEYSSRNRDCGCKDVCSVTNSQGFVSSTEYFDKEVFSKDLSTYKLVEPGMFAYNPSRINVGSVACYLGETPVIVSPLYVVFGTMQA